MKSITQPQRELIIRLMREAEYDTRTVTFQHRRLGVAEHEIGGPIDPWLDSMSTQQASALITKLQAEVA